MVLGVLVFVLHVMLCFIVVLLVLMQRPSGGGALGIGSGLSSSSSASNPFTIIVAVAGFLLFVTSLSIAFLERNRISELDALFKAKETVEQIEELEEMEVPTS